MDNLVIFCKTYIDDLERLQILKESIDKFNVDKIPFVVVAPQAQLDVIKSKILNDRENYEISFFADEQFLEPCDKELRGWQQQQIVKMNFFKLGLCNFFLIVDSDSYFLRDFHIHDFMYDEQTPYIVMHEGKDARLINEALKPCGIYHVEAKVKDFFGRVGKNYRFLTTPVIFSCQVLEDLAKHYNVYNLIEQSSCEAAWHGEYLLHSQLINFKPCEPFFKAIVYQEAYDLYANVLRVQPEEIAKIYLGIVVQARHNHCNLYKAHKYSRLQRGKRFIFSVEKEAESKTITICGLHFKVARKKKLKIEQIDSNQSQVFQDKIQPDVIKNRFDRKPDSTLNKSGGGGYTTHGCLMFKLTQNQNEFYMPVRIADTEATLGMYLRQLDFATLKQFTDYLFKHFKQLQRVFLLHTFTPLPGVKQLPHWHIELPSTIEEFDAALSHDIRYNAKYYPRKFRREIGDFSFEKTLVAETPIAVIQQYLDWKRDSHNFIWNSSPEDYLKEYGVTHVYKLRLGEEYLAIGFTCETGDNVYYENTSYNNNYGKYSIGTILYYHIICDLITCHKKVFYLLGGNHEYKRNYNGVQSLTYTGYIYQYPKREAATAALGKFLNGLPVPRVLKKMLAKLLGIFLFNKRYAKCLKGSIRK